MKDNFGREWELVTLKDKKKKQKEKNHILYPETDKSIEEQLSELFEDDRPKSMEWIMDDILKVVGGTVLFTFVLFYVIASLFAPIAILWLFLIHWERVK